jgi:DNA invertase Pin-like site-specific DNA recombinase
MKFLYVRVSTTEQNTQRQTELSKIYEVDNDNIYIDKLSGENTNRPQFTDMLSKLRKGDTVIVESYSRASRSTKDPLELVETLNKKEVKFISVKENFDTTTPAGKMMLTMFAGFYQFEREMMLLRQREGIEIAKLNGKYKMVGRKKLVPNDKVFEVLYKDWKNGKIKTNDFMKALGLKRNTFYRRIAEYEKDNNIIQTEKNLDKKMRELNQKVRENKQDREQKAVI